MSQHVYEAELTALDAANERLRNTGGLEGCNVTIFIDSQASIETSDNFRSAKRRK